MKILPVIALIAFAVGMPACSSPTDGLLVNPTSTPIVKSCSEAAVTQFDMNKCAGEAADATHNKLDALLDELHSHMSMAQYQELTSIQDKWEQIVREHCQWEAGFFTGGSSLPMWIAGCLEKQYRQRIDALRFDLCEGHGLTGDCEAASKYK